MNGMVPNDLLKHTVEREYIILGLEPSEFIKKHGAVEFSLPILQQQFKTICEDYMEALVGDIKSKAVEFCSLVIYEIGPESRKGSKTSDKVWKVRFPYSVNGALKTKTLFIATYRTETFKSLYEKDEKMVVTVKQAGLLAMDTFDRLTDVAYNMSDPVTLLTPLAGSIFSREDIPEMAKLIGTTPSVITKAINNSCQSGGQYLASSTINVAVVPCIVATRNIKDKDLMHSIIGKIIRQYLSCGKTFKPDKFSTYCVYAHGGVPSEMNVDKLVSEFTKLNEPAGRRALLAAMGTAQTAFVSVPSNIP